MKPHAYVLTLSCPDRLGLVHAVSGFLLEHGGNIEEAAQFNDHGTGLFFMRVQFACERHDHATLREHLQAFAEPHQMRWSLHALAAPMRTVIMVSREGHCLNDLLFRWKSGLLPLDIRAIISNHREFYQLAASYNVPFHHIPVTAATKAQAEAKQLDIIRSEGAELVVLTKGAEGATGYTANFKVSVPSNKVEVVDTVGAGDTFDAGILASLKRQGLLTKEKVATLSEEAVREALTVGAKAAAVTVSRAGANPPTAAEIGF